MLVGKSKSARSRVWLVLGATLAVTAVGLGLAATGAAVGLWAWPPEPSSPLGVGCGVAGGLIVLFEMALLPKKWWRGRRLVRRLGATQAWMRWHVWLGLASLPIILVHAGLGFGGPLPMATLILFLLVILSGVWGLVMQQWLPSKMLASVPNETVATEVDHAVKTHVTEAERLVVELTTVPAEGGDLLPSVRRAVPPGARPTTPVVAGGSAAELKTFLRHQLVPYLNDGRRSRSALVSRAEAGRRFARLATVLPDAARPAVDRLAELCDLRRQWDELRRLHWWLHGWLAVHLPLSVAMTGLMVVHAVRALKFW